MAVLQVTGLIERECEVQLAEETVAEADTPRILLRFINESLSTTV
ncbi:hypothetical protein P3T27_006213 [Kitasatospora sp. MAA19]|nr:hypothetical protein [Kitasatospora sp. MAA19]